MTTETTWYPFPGRPDYEISDEGGLRTTLINAVVAATERSAQLGAEQAEQGKKNQ